MRNDNKNRRFKYLIILLISMFVNLFVQGSIVEVRTSESTSSANPGDYMIDNNPDTYWGFRENSVSGWAEIVLDSEQLIYGIEILGSMPESVLIDIGFKRNGVYQPFVGASFSGINDGGQYIDLSYNRSVTDNIVLKLTGSNIDKGKITSINVSGISPEEASPYKINPISLDVSTDTSNYYPATNLIDGNVNTRWMTKTPAYSSSVDYILKDLHSKNPLINKWISPDYQGRGVVIMNLEREYQLEKIKLFFPEQLKTDVLVEVAQSSGWHLIENISDNASGWYTVNCKNISANRIRLTMLGNKNTSGQIGEVEIWSDETFLGEKHEPLTGTIKKSLNKPYNLHFKAKKEDFITIEILLEGIHSNPLEVQLNEKILVLSRNRIINGNTLYCLNPDYQDLWDGFNFIRIHPVGNNTDLLGVWKKKSRENGFVNYSFSEENENNIILTLNSTAEVEKIDFLKDDIIPESVSVLVDGKWTTLSPSGNTNDTISYTPGIITGKVQVQTINNGLLHDVRITGSPIIENDPEIRIIWPQNGSMIENSDSGKYVIGTIDNPDCNVLINGKKASKKGQYFYYQISSSGIFGKGEANLNIEAVTPEGLKSEEILEFYLNESWKMQIDQKEDLLFTTDESITISGKILQAYSIVEIDGQIVTQKSGPFSAEVALAEGLNFITIIGKSKYVSDEKIFIKKVVRYSQDLELSILAPEDNQVTSSNEIIVTGMVFGVGDVIVNVNGVPARVDGYYFISEPVSLIKGENNITVDAIDQLDRSSNIIITVKKDNTPPVITNIRPADGMILTQFDFRLIFQIEDESNVWAFINDQVCEQDGLEYFLDYALVDNSYTFNIKATDMAGNTATETIELIIDTTLPESFTVNINPSSWSDNAQPVVSFDTVDLTSGIDHFELKIDDGEYFVMESPYTLPPLGDGIHKISVKAVDKAGWERIETEKAMVDTVPPLDFSVSADPAEWSNNNTPVITFNTTDATSGVNRYEVSIDNNAYFTISSPYTLPKLGDGEHEIKVRAIDHAGLMTSSDVTVYVDTEPPLPFAVTANPASWTNNTQPEISFSTTDVTSGINRYELSIDNNPFYEILSPYILPEQADGVHKISIRAIDNAGLMRSAETEVFIDTTAPKTPQQFRAIPGNQMIRVKASEVDLDVIAYHVERTPAWSEGIKIVTEFTIGETELADGSKKTFQMFELEDRGLINGDVYSYKITAVDRANNFSGTAETSKAIVALEEEIYNPEEGSVVEYENVNLIIPEEALPSEIKKIRISEIISEDLEEEASFPIISPIYHYSGVVLIDGEEQELDHIQFEKNYLGTITYKEENIPEGFAEQDLGVYYFDTNWGRWFQIKEAAVDIENNTIYFSTNHFTDFSVQPTMIEDVSPQELADVEFSPFKTDVQHGKVQVSPQGGSASMEVTEMVLPGRNGFDFVLKRTYDSATARGDGPGLAINAEINVTMSNMADLGKVAGDLAKSAGIQLASQVENMVKKYFQSNGDYSYSMGLGWRLNLPYISGTNSSVLLRLPNGSFHSINKMVRIQNLPFPHGRSMLFENHEGQDFSLRVNQIQGDWSFVDMIVNNNSNPIIPGWTTISAELTLKDGTRYWFDAFGRVTKMMDPSGLNEINFFYNGMVLDYILDSVGRIIKFEYTENLIPRIKRIWIENDPYEREIKYNLQDSPLFGWGMILPLLTEAEDVGGRKYTYNYDDMFLLSGGGGVKINPALLILDFITGGAASEVGTALFGLSSVTLHGNIQTEWVYPIKSASGPGIGHTDISNEVKTLSYGEIEGKDYFLGLFPTSVDFNFNVVQRVLVSSLHERLTSNSEILHTITYQYDLRYADHHQFYNNQTTVNDGRSIVIYNFNYLTRSRLRFFDLFDLASDLIKNALNSKLFLPNVNTTEIIPYNTEVVIRDAEKDSFLQKTMMEYYFSQPSPVWGVDATLMRLKKQTIYRSKNNKSVTEYKYDNWGNITYQHQSSQTGDRSTLSRTWSHYYNTNSTKVAEALWRHDSPYTAPSLTVNRHDLLLEQIIENNLPPESGHTAPIYTHQNFGYSNKGFRTGIAQWTGSTWAKTTIEYYDSPGEHGEVKRVIKPLTETKNHITEYSYDYDSDHENYYVTATEKEIASLFSADGNLKDITTTTAFEKQSGWVRWKKGPRGYVTGFRYDSLGRTTAINAPMDSDDQSWNPILNYFWREAHPVTTVFYNEASLSVTITNSEGAVVLYDFDNLGRLNLIEEDNRTTDDTGSLIIEKRRQQLNYNSWGDIIKVVNPLNYATDYEFDAIGKLNKIIFPDGNVKQMEFNYGTNTQTIIDERGNTSRQIFDMQNRLIQGILYNGQETINTYVYYDGMGNESVIIDGNGNKTINLYDERNLLAKVILPEDHFYENGSSVTLSPVKRLEYNLSGHKIREISETANGDHSITFDVDGLGRTFITRVPYTENDNENGTTYQKQNVERFYLDQAGNPLFVIDPDNTPLLDDYYHPTFFNQTPLPAYIANTYSTLGKVLSTCDQAGNTTTFTYNTLGNTLSMTDPRENCGKYSGDFTIIYHYDDLKRLIKAELPRSRNLTTKPVVEYTYDLRGNVIKEIDPKGAVKSYTYTERNWKKTETLTGSRLDGTPVSYTSRYYYDDIGNLVKIEDNDSNATTHLYDFLNRVIVTTYPEGNRDKVEYDNNGNQIAIIDGNDNSKEYTYNSFNLVTSIINANLNTSYTYYDRLGRVTRIEDMKRRSMFYEYDALNRLIHEVTKEGNRLYYNYDGRGNLLYTKNPNEVITLNKFTANNLLIRQEMTKDGIEHIREFKYDEAGALIWVKDGDIVTEYNTPASSESDTSFKIDLYIPDPYGNIYSETNYIDGKAYTVRYDYDHTNLLTTITYPDEEKVQYNYNSIGQLENIPGYINDSIVYNNRGLLESIKAANGIDMELFYDENSRLKVQSYNKAEEEIKNYFFTYDDANNIIGKNNNSYTYDVLNRLEFAALNGKFEIDVTKEKQNVGYVTDDLLAEKALTFNVADERIQLDYAASSIGIDLGNIYSVSRIELTSEVKTQRIEARHLAVFVSNDNSENSYQEISGWVLVSHEDGQLEIKFKEIVDTRFIKVHCYFDDRAKGKEADISTSEFFNSSTEVITVYYMINWRYESYSYDEVGNRLSESITLKDSESFDYSYYDNSDRLKIKGNLGFLYDQNGNLIARGLVKEASGEGGSILDTASSEYWEYTYDFLNRLLRVENYEPSILAMQVIAEYEYNHNGYRIKKRDKKGEASFYIFSIGGSLLYEEKADKIKEYIYAFNKNYAFLEKNNSAFESEEKYFYHTDYLGSVIAVSNISGDIVWQSEYSPFGEQTGTIGILSDQGKFTGKDLDYDTGLYYFNARWYDSDLGRFITEDPIRDGMNWYAYTANNPMTFIDPSGLKKIGNEDEYYFSYDELIVMEVAIQDYQNKNNLQEVDRSRFITKRHYEKYLDSLKDGEKPRNDLIVIDMDDYDASFKKLNGRNLERGGFYNAEDDTFYYSGNYRDMDLIFYSKIQDGVKIFQDGIISLEGIDNEDKLLLECPPWGWDCTTGNNDLDYFLTGFALGAGSTANMALQQRVNSLSLYLNNQLSNNSMKGTIRVGRWMSQAEYKKMLETGKVQMSAGNMTHVTNPPDPSAFKAAKAGSVFVEFNVPTNSVVSGGKAGWGIIPGKGSLYDRYSLKSGGIGYSMPSVTNITKVQ